MENDVDKVMDTHYRNYVNWRVKQDPELDVPIGEKYSQRGEGSSHTIYNIPNREVIGRRFVHIYHAYKQNKLSGAFKPLEGETGQQYLDRLTVYIKDHMDYDQWKWKEEKKAKERPDLKVKEELIKTNWKTGGHHYPYFGPGDV